MQTLDYIRDVQIYQNKSGYRFSVDALLLHSFASSNRAKLIADLCTGSGIIGLLAAKKHPKAHVYLVELQKSLYNLCVKNISLNNMSESVTAVHADINEIITDAKKRENLLSIGAHKGRHQKHIKQETDSPFELLMESAGCFDLVVSNPPFRKVKAGMVSSGDEKAIARHEIKISIHQLAEAASRLLAHRGRFCMIHLPERMTEIFDSMRGCGMEPKRLRTVHSNLESEASMILVEGIKGAKPGIKSDPPLILYNADGSYTKELNAMYNG
ncbi:MAG: tRNA1(Val) (adenine(37)-N6)-methyltransferase [Nitrospiraceae bacterium]|nr:tRNA1(Val) (adenine(37)-N6)-methyltransferase [Nitrospiraceae bacterium]